MPDLYNGRSPGPPTLKSGSAAQLKRELRTASACTRFQSGRVLPVSHI